MNWNQAMNNSQLSWLSHGQLSLMWLDFPSIEMLAGPNVFFQYQAGSSPVLKKKSGRGRVQVV